MHHHRKIWRLKTAIFGKSGHKWLLVCCKVRWDRAKFSSHICQSPSIRFSSIRERQRKTSRGELVETYRQIMMMAKICQNMSLLKWVVTTFRLDCGRTLSSKKIMLKISIRCNRRVNGRFED
jgi:hypothetical protein